MRKLGKINILCKYRMNTYKKQDISLGDLGEKEMYAYLKQCIDGDLVKHKNNWAVFDFSSDKSVVELKTRRIRHNQFGDIMIGANKLQKASCENRDVFFVWNCVDGVFYWKYNQADIDNGYVEYREGGTTRRGEDESCLCGFVNTSILLPLLPLLPSF